MFRRSWAMAASALCLVVLAGSGFLTSCSDDSGTDRLSESMPNAIPQPGNPSSDAADLTYQTFDGTPATLATYEGNPIVVNFFASWCVPCVTEMPDFEAIHQELGDRVTFVGMNYGGGGETLGGAKDIVARTKITYDVGRDVDGALLKAVGGVTMPTTVFVRADGTIAKVRSGAVSKSDLRDLIRSQLGVS